MEIVRHYNFKNAYRIGSFQAKEDNFLYLVIQNQGYCVFKFTNSSANKNKTKEKSMKTQIFNTHIDPLS